TLQLDAIDSLTPATLRVLRSPKAIVPSKPRNWAATFSPREFKTTGIGDRSYSVFYGTISIAQSSAQPSRAQIDLTAGQETNTEHTWGIYPGRCGSTSLEVPLVGPAMVPPLRVSGNGKARLLTE